jgi:hypothetical protein
VNQGPIWGRLLKKTRGRQSRATVPLSRDVNKTLLIYNISGRLFADEHFNGAVEAATTLTGAILGMLSLYIAVLKGSTLLYNLHTIDR